MQEQASCPEGSEPRASGLRMAPGDVAHVPPDPLAGSGSRSDCKALPLAGAASPLTCPPAAANPSTFAALTTPGGLRSLRSASSLPFLVTCQRQVIPSHSFAALTALIVRRVKGDIALSMRRIKGDAALLMHCINGFAEQPMPASASRRATPKGVERAPGSGTLPHA